MFFRYHRAGRLSLLPALAAVAAGLILAGVAAITLVVVGVAVCGIWLVRAIGRSGRAGRRTPVQDHQTIEGVVVRSTDVFDRPLSPGRLQPLGDLDQQPHEQHHGRADDENRHRAQQDDQ